MAIQVFLRLVKPICCRSSWVILSHVSWNTTLVMIKLRGSSRVASHAQLHHTWILWVRLLYFFLDLSLLLSCSCRVAKRMWPSSSTWIHQTWISLNGRGLRNIILRCVSCCRRWVRRLYGQALKLRSSQIESSSHSRVLSVVCGLITGKFCQHTRFCAICKRFLLLGF